MNTETAISNPIKVSTKVDIKEAFRLKLTGLSYQEVADRLGVSKAAVHKRIQGLIPDDTDVETYKENRADVFAGLQAQILKTVCDDDLKKTSFSQKIVGVGILYDKERLERGQSTSNMALALGEVRPEDAGSARDFIAKQVADALTSEDKRAND